MDENPSKEQLREELEESGFHLTHDIEIRMQVAAVQIQLAEEGLSEEEIWDVTIFPTIESLRSRLERRLSNINQLVKEYEEMNEEDRLTDIGSETTTEFLVRSAVADDLLTYFVVGHDAIETFSIRLLNRELTTEHYQGSNRTMELFEEISQPHRQGLLKRCGILDHEVVDAMDDVRKLRNDLVHDPSVRQAIDFEPVPEADKIQFVLNAFHEEFRGEKFWEREDEQE